MNQSAQSTNRQIAKAAGTVMAAFLISNLFGLVRQILIANAFGTGMEMEAFNAANRVSETLFNLVAGGALASAFIPTFTALLARNLTEKAWRLASAIANLVLLVTISTGLIAAIAAPWIVQNILAPGFSNDPVKVELTVDLMRLMLPSAVIFGLSGLVMGILNSYQIFFVSALAPAMYQAGLIFGVLVLVPGLGIFGLGWGVLVGALLHLALQLPSLFRLKGKYHFIVEPESPDVREVIRLMLPRLLGVAFVQLNFWINTRLASQFMEGSVTGIIYGFTLMLMPQAAIAQSIAIAALPAFSAQVALGKLNEMRNSFAMSLRGALILSIPASMGLILLSTPLVSLLYQRGEFNDQSTELVAWALVWYAAGLVGHAVVEITSRAFYSLHDTKTPVLVGIFAMAANVVLSYVFSSLFLRRGWMPHGGLALANSVATGLESIGLLYLMHQRLSGLGGRLILDGIWRALIASIVMALTLYGWKVLIGSRAAWFEAGSGLLIGGCSFLIACLALGVTEVQSALRFVQRRFAG